MSDNIINNRKFILKNNLNKESDSLYEYEKNSCLKFEWKEWLTSNEASDYLGISTSRLMNLTSNGIIPYYKFGRSNRYLVSELKTLLMSQPKGTRYGN